jgi:hypothetical protein
MPIIVSHPNCKTEPQRLRLCSGAPTPLPFVNAQMCAPTTAFYTIHPFLRTQHTEPSPSSSVCSGVHHPYLPSRSCQRGRLTTFTTSYPYLSGPKLPAYVTVSSAPAETELQRLDLLGVHHHHLPSRSCQRSCPTTFTTLYPYPPGSELLAYITVSSAKAKTEPQRLGLLGVHHPHLPS